MPAPSIGALPVPPKSNDSQAVFKSKRKPWLDGFEVFIDELNSLILWINTEYAESGMQIDILPDATKYADPKDEFNTESNATAIALDNFIVQMNLLIEATGAPELSPINPLPPHPNKVTDSKSVFNKRAFAWMAALAGTSIADSSGSGLSGIAGQINGFVDFVNNQTDSSGSPVPSNYDYDFINRNSNAAGSSPLGDGGGTGWYAGSTTWPGEGTIEPNDAPFVGDYSNIHFGYQEDVSGNLFFVLHLQGSTGEEIVTVTGTDPLLATPLSSINADYGAIYGSSEGWYWQIDNTLSKPTSGGITITVEIAPPATLEYTYSEPEIQESVGKRGYTFGTFDDPDACSIAAGDSSGFRTQLDPTFVGSDSSVGGSYIDTIFVGQTTPFGYPSPPEVGNTYGIYGGYIKEDSGDLYFVIGFPGGAGSFDIVLSGDNIPTFDTAEADGKFWVPYEFVSDSFWIWNLGDNPIPSEFSSSAGSLTIQFRLIE